jgi:hypothetical protein
VRSSSSFFSSSDFWQESGALRGRGGRPGERKRQQGEARGAGGAGRHEFPSSSPSSHRIPCPAGIDEGRASIEKHPEWMQATRF